MLLRRSENKADATWEDAVRLASARRRPGRLSSRVHSSRGPGRVPRPAESDRIERPAALDRFSKVRSAGLQACQRGRADLKVCATYRRATESKSANRARAHRTSVEHA